MIKNLNREYFERHALQKGSSLVVGVVFIALMLPLALPVLLELKSPPTSVDKPSKYAAALTLAQAGIEKAIWEMNNGDISSWEGDYVLRTRTLFSLRDSSGKETGDVEIRVKWPYEQYPIVEAVGRVVYSSSIKKGTTTRFIVERKARTVLQRDGYTWVSVFPELSPKSVTVVKGSL